jgi:hypothetical protein
MEEEQERIAQALFDLSNAYAYLCRELGESSQAGDRSLVEMGMAFSLALAIFGRFIADTFDITLVPITPQDLFRVQEEAARNAENN